MGELGALFWIGITVFGSGLVLVNASGQHRWGVFLSLAGLGIVVASQRHELAQQVRELAGTYPSASAQGIRWLPLLCVLGVAVLGSVLGSLWKRHRARRKMRANAERDIDHELRRLLGLLLLELYRDANKSPNAGSDLREAGEYAKAAVAELKRLKLDAPQANLRKALIELVDAFALRDAVKGRSALPENELLAVAKTVYALPRVRDEIERFLFPDLEATCQLLSILHFDLATLPRTAVEVLLCLDDNSELHLVDSSDWETIDVRVMPSGRRFGERISIRATTTPHPYWDGTSKLKTAGLLVGTNIAPHRLTGFGRAVRQVCLAALRRRSLGSRLLSSVGRPFVSRPPRAEEA